MHVVSGKSRTTTGAQSDLGLMRLVAGGDSHAQRVLAHRVASRVQRLSQRLLANDADAEDAAQMALMEILRSAATYREESSIERWADRIAVRTTLRHAREQRRRSWLLGRSDDEVRTHVEDTSPSNPNEETPRRLEEYLC